MKRAFSTVMFLCLIFTGKIQAGSMLFDMQPDTSPVASGAIKILATSAYSGSLGYGWITSPTGEFDRGSPSHDLKRDGVSGTGSAVFAIDVPNGDYDVTFTIGDASFPHDLMGLFLEGSQVDSVSLLAGDFYQPTYFITVSDGQLNVQMTDGGGTDPTWVWNGLEISSDSLPEVPEPSTLIMLLTGGVSLIGYGWRRKKKLAA